MKKVYCLIMLAFIGFCGNAQIERINVEEIPLSGPIGLSDLSGYTNYRLFAEATDADDQVFRVLGVSICPLNITSTTSFYRHPALTATNPTGENINPAFWQFGALETRFSSCISIGEAAEGYLGIPE